MVKVIFATLQESGFLARFDELKQLLVAKDVPAASGIVEAIESWTKAVEAFASREASEILRADQVREGRTLADVMPGVLMRDGQGFQKWHSRALIL